MCVRISRTFTITEEKIKQYAFLSGDFNQIHFDQEEAERYGFKAPIAHGMLTMGITSEIASFTEQGMRISKYEMQFIQPILQNDSIHIVAEEKKRDHDSIHLVITGRNRNEWVVKGELTLECLPSYTL